MAGFEFLFTFYGLLLGLAASNVATSFGAILRSHKQWKIGTLVPLLGAVVLLVVAQQWVSFWFGRAELSMGAWPMLVSMSMALPYILVSAAMFPSSFDHGGSLDDHYAERSRALMVWMTVPPVISLAYNSALFFSAGNGLRAYSEMLAVGFAIRLLVPFVLIFARNRQAHRIGLVLLCADALFKIFAQS